MIDLKSKTDRQLAIFIVEYNGNKATEKRISKILSFYNRNMLENFVKNRI